MSNNSTLADKLDGWAEIFTSAAQSIRSSPQQDDFDPQLRLRIAQTAEAATRAVQQPGEQLVANMTVFAQLTATRLFIKWKVFEAIPMEGSITYSDLARTVQADEPLIRRFAWALVSMGTLEQLGEDRVAHTASSKMHALKHPLSSVLQMGFDSHLASMLAMPSYFDKYGLKEPTGRYDTIFAYAMGDPSLTVWEHNKASDERQHHFMVSMVAMASRFPVVGSYDFRWVVEEAEKSPERTLIVDVGGGKGHALETICKATTGLAINRCVVEDLPEVVEAASKDAQGELAKTKFIAMDFHSEQPVKGALVYYIRRCLHDYGDEVAMEMLQQLQQAMAPDSRVLIVEELLSNPPSPLASASDIIMSTLGGKERTLADFESIASRVGLRIVEAHCTEGSGVAVIECARRD